jgi:hypothetical protein
VYFAAVSALHCGQQLINQLKDTYAFNPPIRAIAEVLNVPQRGLRSQRTAPCRLGPIAVLPARQSQNLAHKAHYQRAQELLQPLAARADFFKPISAGLLCCTATQPMFRDRASLGE